MGRMLEALKQPQANRGRPAEEDRSRPTAPPAEVPAPPEIEEDMPFIEVGGPKGSVSGSPEVMAKAPPPRPAAAPAPEAPTAVGSAVRTVPPPPSPSAAPPENEAAPWAVQFRPWGQQPAAARFAPELIAFHQPEHSVSAQYRLLLNGLLAHLPAPRGQVLLFTSPAPWTGTTTVLLNLAVTAARQEGRRVAVVDANLRRPALSGRLGIAAFPGLRDVLAGSVPLARALQETAQPNLWALSAGRAEAGDVRLPFDWLMPTLRQLREQFDLVFVDAPSWNEGSEVSALAATCDAVFMVLHQKDGAQGEKGLPGLRQPPTNLQGCILTMR